MGEDGRKRFPLKPNHPAVTTFHSDAGGTLLAHFDTGKETWLETDASDLVAAVVLSQMVLC